MKSIKTLIIAFVILLNIPSLAFGQAETDSSISSTSSTFSVVVGEEGGEAGLDDVDSGETVDINVEPNRCYCCFAYSDLASDNVRFGTTQINADEGGFSSLTVTARGRAAPRMEANRGRVCFSTGTFESAVVRLELLHDDSGDDIDDVRMRCDETTLYGGYNTSVTDFNFLELTSTLNPDSSGTQTITGTITATNVVTSPDTTVIDEQEFTLNAGSRTDVDIHTAAGTSTFGPVRVCHNGPPGSVSAVMSQYRITSSTPLEFEPVAQEVFQSQAQLMNR